MASELDAVLSKVKKEYGEQIVRASNLVDLVERIPTGIFPFDLATGGGVPRGRITIIYGAESSGKTTVALKLIAHVQRVLKKRAVYIDLEHTYDVIWTAKFGVNVDDLVVLRPENAEQAVDLIDAIMYADDVGIVVIDSLAAMVTENEIDSEAGKTIVAGSALIVGKLVRKVVVALTTEHKRAHKPAVVFINQTRVKVGVMYGDPETMPGGFAPKFASSMTVRLYGSNKMIKEVNEALPAYKETSCILKKWKVPITASNFKYDLCLIPHNGLQVGDSPSWNTVSNHLKQHGALVNTGKGWTCFGENFKTLSDLQTRYEQEPAIRAAMQLDVITKEMKHLMAPMGPNNENMGVIEVPDA